MQIAPFYCIDIPCATHPHIHIVKLLFTLKRYRINLQLKINVQWLMAFFISYFLFIFIKSNKIPEYISCSSFIHFKKHINCIKGII